MGGPGDPGGLPGPLPRPKGPATIVDTATIDALADKCFTMAGLPEPRHREQLRVWALSGVERVHLPGGATVFLKYAREPFTDEPRVLAHVARHQVPVPELFASAVSGDTMAMVIEDLGDPDRDATTTDAATAAVATHAAPPPPGLTRLDGAALRALPASCLKRLGELVDAGRWPEPTPDIEALDHLADVALVRAEDADTAPFGLCHSEFHPTSIHISRRGSLLLDWARAFTGPGLLDLASWQNTAEPPDLDALDALIAAYIAAGGAKSARDDRGGLPVARWAVGWHRLWVIDWYLEQATTWINDPSTDPTYQQVIRRHLAEAVECLTGP